MEKWLFTILQQAKKKASPALLENLRTSMQGMVDHAATTDNAWDDIYAWIMQSLVGKPGDTTEPSE